MKSDRNYVYTEREHFMCSNMHFGIMAKIESNYDEEQLIQSIDILQKMHSFLQSLIAEEKDTGRIYYQIQDYLNIPVMVKEEVSKPTEIKWVCCPICGNKTRIQIRKDTVLLNFPLHCPKCK